MGAGAHPGGQLGVGLSKEGCSGQTLVFQRRPPRGGREGACARGCWKVRKVRIRWSRMERGWPGWGGPGPATGHLQGGAGWEPANEEWTWLCRASCSVLLPQEQRLPGTSAVAMETTEVPTC